MLYRPLVAVVALLAVPLVAGLVAERHAEQTGLRKFQPAGRLVSIGD
jgi:hypothetical protein